MRNPVLDCIRRHRSIRRFMPDPVPEEMIEAIVHSGTRAATAGNLQLYSFLVVDDPVKLALLAELAGPFASPPPLVILALIDLHRIRRWFEVNDTAKPVLNSPAYFMLAYWDAIAALQNLVLAAESLGLGTCYYGAVLQMDTRKHFGTPELVYPAGMVCIGSPDEDPELRSRLPIEAVLHRNEYQSPDDDTIDRIYQERNAVWEKVGEERKAALREQGIGSIPQALAVQRFSEEATGSRSAGILEAIARAGFTFEEWE